MKKPNTSIVAVAAAFILVAASAKAAEFQQSVEDGQGHYLATESGNWTSGDYHFFLNPYTVTFNTADLSFSDAIRIRSASGAFGDAADILSDSNDRWLVWQSIDGSTDYGLTLSGSGNKVRLSDESGNVARLKITSGTYTVTGGSLDVAARTASAYILQTGGLLKVPDGAMVLGCTYSNGTSGNQGGYGYYTLQGGAATLKQAVLNNAQNGKGVLKVAGGDLTIADYLRIAEGSSTAGEFVQTAGHTSVGSYLCVGSQSDSAKSGYNALFQLDGGTVTNTGTAMIIGARGDSAAQAKAVVNDGELVAKQIWVAEYSAGTNELEINGGSVAVSGDFYIAKQSGSNGKLTLNGGTLQTTGIKTTATAAIDFNGGIITDAGSGSHTLVTAATTAKVLSGGAKFAIPGGAEAKILAALATGVAEGKTDGGLVKKGDGTLTLASGNSYAGPTVVEGGSLVLPVGGSLASTKLELAGGTFSGTTFDDITISAGAYSFSSLPTNTTSTVTLNGGVLRMTVAEAQATADTATVVVNGGTLLIDGNTAESVSVGSSFTFATVTLGDNVEVADVVKVSGVNFDWTYGSSGGHPTATAGTAFGENVWVGGAEGYWKDNVNWAYGVPAASATAYINNDAHIIFDANKTVASIRVNATVTFSSQNSGSVHPELSVHDVDGTGTLRLDHVGFRGNGGDKRIGSASDNKLTLEYVTASTDAWLVDISVYAPITGSGYVRLYNGTWLYGDNTSFTGTVKKDDGDVRFTAPCTGFPNASSVTIDGTIWLWFDEGEIEFGGRFTAYATGNCGINLPGTVRAVTMTVGGGNGSVIISRGWDKKDGWRPYYSAFVDSNGWQQGTDKFTLRKVGTGAITEYGVQSVYNFSLEGGSINLGAEKVYTGPDTRLTVANATLGIAAATTVASVSFESGAIIRQAIAVDGDTYTCPTLTITGNVNVTGLVCDLVDADNYLASAQATDTLPTFTLLSATSVTGTPTGAIDMATDGWAWMPKVKSGTQVVMSGRCKKPGFILTIR